MIVSLFALLFLLIRLYSWVLIIMCIYSLLLAANVLDRHNRLVWGIGDFLYRITEPVLAPIRRILPDTGMVDLSPLVLMLALRYLLIPALLWIEGSILMHSAGVGYGGYSGF
ncbi:YggT family protein [Endobacter medicaginis]|uniref:YggT family protein n=1 Tax=Endobacter medicaginis TaxID=1181271 RepID=A0A839UQW2_9PROT|nr:YggT family protein [Endobacter medicaginis]MBB3172196.1 YggT family protein [Endobacter medicaginis]MCX5476556.1 YggT family protein [Endobacter medicaginis]NVN31355.1 YggT family protein [Endobacter medicaginis]